MAADAKHLGEHNANRLHTIGHLDARHFLHRHHIRQVIHYATEIIDAIGVRDEGVPRLTLAHLFGAAMVIPDVWNGIDEYLSV